MVQVLRFGWHFQQICLLNTKPWEYTDTQILAEYTVIKSGAVLQSRYTWMIQHRFKSLLIHGTLPATCRLNIGLNYWFNIASIYSLFAAPCQQPGRPGASPRIQTQTLDSIIGSALVQQKCYSRHPASNLGGQAPAPGYRLNIGCNYWFSSGSTYLLFAAPCQQSGRPGASPWIQAQHWIQLLVQIPYFGRYLQRTCLLSTQPWENAAIQICWSSNR